MLEGPRPQPRPTAPLHTGPLERLRKRGAQHSSVLVTPPLSIYFLLLNCGALYTQDPEHGRQIKGNIGAATCTHYASGSPCSLPGETGHPGTTCRFPQSRGLPETLFSAYFPAQPRTPGCPINASLLRNETSSFFSSYTPHRNTQ